MWGRVREHYIHLFVGSQLWDKVKVKLDYHTAVNHFEQNSNPVYASLIVILCFPVLMVNQFI